MPNNVVGPIHGLCVQLYSSGIIELKLSHDGQRHLGKPTLMIKHVVVALGMAEAGSGIRMPAWFNNNSWLGLHFIPETKQRSSIDVNNTQGMEDNTTVRASCGRGRSQRGR